MPGLTWQPELPWARHVWWLFTIQLDDRVPLGRFDVMAAMRERGVEVRQIIYPNHMLPPYVGLWRILPCRGARGGAWPSPARPGVV